MSKITIRCGLFETNSSTTHAFVWLSDEAYNKFAYEDYYLDLRGENGVGVAENGEDYSDHIIAPKDIGDVVSKLRKAVADDDYVPVERAAVIPETEILMYAGIVAACAERDREDWLDFGDWEAEKTPSPDGRLGWNVYVDWSDFTQMWAFDDYEPGKRDYW